MICQISVLIVALLSGLAASPRPLTPLEQVRATADKVIGLLNDPSLQGDSKRVERHRLIRAELEERFDWNSIGRSCLGRHWSKLSAAQQKEFIELFKSFLERTYLDRIEPYYQELDRVEYQGERILETKYASVKSVIFTKQKVGHSVEYRLEKGPAGAWRVYDVVIEGVSFAKNYRTQFDEIISRSSVEDLLKDLRTKSGPTS